MPIYGKTLINIARTNLDLDSKLRSLETSIEPMIIASRIPYTTYRFDMDNLSA